MALFFSFIKYQITRDQNDAKKKMKIDYEIVNTGRQIIMVCMVNHNGLPILWEYIVGPSIILIFF